MDRPDDAAMASNPRERIAQAARKGKDWWWGQSGGCEYEAMGVAAAREALTIFDEIVTSKFTPALNTGTAMDALILTALAMRELRAHLTPKETSDGMETSQDGSARDSGGSVLRADRGASSLDAQTVTPDAALLAEADTLDINDVRNDPYEAFTLIRDLSAALRSALQREQEMIGGWVCEVHPWLAWPHGDCPGPGCPIMAQGHLGWVRWRDVVQERDIARAQASEAAIFAIDVAARAEAAERDLASLRAEQKEQQ